MTALFPILWVDDDPHIVDLLNRVATPIFAEANFVAIASFSQAIAYLENLAGPAPRLILLAIDRQTERRGIDFLKLIKTHPRSRPIPIIVLAGACAESGAEQACRLDANAFTLKPTSLPGWQDYIYGLKTYWYQMATVPRLGFERLPDSS